ncbi:MAG TPA: diadenylate cyclase CdaA [Gemmatimonadales bacterium]|jgi:diadenylate cyclase
MPLEQLPLPVPHWRDLIEILLVAVVLYRVLRFLVGTRALQIVFGLLALVGIYIAALLLQLTMIPFLLGLGFTYAPFAALVVFQPELRQALARLGQTRVFRWFAVPGSSAAAGEIAEALARLSAARVGAIVAVEQGARLDEYVESGKALQATVSAELLAAIFSPYSPLHDGAVVVRGDQIVAAGCILPLTQSARLDRGLGTRHRAALGLSEETDAVVLVVSEETSTVSAARRGRLERNLSPEQVRTLLGGPAAPEAVVEQVAI